MDVGNVHFQNRPFESLERVKDGNGSKRVARWIDDDRIGTQSGSTPHDRIARPPRPNARICPWLSTGHDGARPMTIAVRHLTNSAMPLGPQRLPRHPSSPQSLTARLFRRALASTTFRR